ncbi:Myb/SANT-like DNA-binding domain 4 [Dillenia turbinata]|uniref:Myb/SANT-like DNA-binding domain 4 n=1 Tax=Dillenia turbinata TaxID=194707 RepID=A0AAN8UKM3_9MAGN
MESQSQTPQKPQALDNEKTATTTTGSRRTRSHLAPEWTSKDCLILVNEIAAVAGDCHKAFSSYQKWCIIAENCTALDVARTTSQCRRKWQSLVADYKVVRQWLTKQKRKGDGTMRCFWDLDGERRRELGLPVGFDEELFNSIGDVIRAQKDLSETEPESDPESEAAEADVPNVDIPTFSVYFLGIPVTKKPKRQPKPLTSNSEEEPIVAMKLPKKKGIKRPGRRGIAHSSCSEEKAQVTAAEVGEDVESGPKASRSKTMPQNFDVEAKAQMLAADLLENVKLIHGILGGTHIDDGDLSLLADLKNSKHIDIETVRQQGDELITCFGDLTNTLDQLCDLVDVNNL